MKGNQPQPWLFTLEKNDISVGSMRRCAFHKVTLLSVQPERKWVRNIAYSSMEVGGAAIAINSILQIILAYFRLSSPFPR